MNTPLRIIQVVNVRWFNATAWYGLFLARLLTDAGHRVLTLVLPGTAPEAKAKEMGLAYQALPLNSANPFLLAQTAAKLAALVRGFKPDIVNCHRGESVFLWGLLKRSGMQFSLVRTRGDQRPPKGNAANRYVHGKLADVLIATNSRTLFQCRELLALPDEKLRLVLGGVDTSLFFPDALAGQRVRAALGFADTDVVVGLLGRFDHVKGQRELMQAVRCVLDRAKPGTAASRLKLMLMGFPTAVSLETVQGWVREYGLEARAVITGRVHDVNAHINAMNIGVIASQGSEAIARAAFEIMACNVQLVGTDVGVMPDLLPAEALAPVGNSAALAALLERAANDAAFCERLLKSRQERMPELTQQSFLEKTLSVYYNCLL